MKKTKNKSRLQELDENAKFLNLTVARYSPGGRPKYRFFHSPNGESRGFFSGDGLFTAIGMWEAEIFLTGYNMGSAHQIPGIKPEAGDLDGLMYEAGNKT